jgi:hypothetical protein
MFHGSFRAVRPRHPIARLITGVIGIIAVLAMLALGMFAIAALAIGGGVFLLINALRSGPRPAASAAGARKPAPPPGIIEGEFTVVPATPSRPQEPASRR